MSDDDKNERASEEKKGGLINFFEKKMKTKTLVKKTLRRQRKAFCWLKKNGHMAFRQDSKKHRKQLYKYFNDETKSEPQFNVGGIYSNDWEQFFENN